MAAKHAKMVVVAFCCFLGVLIGVYFILSRRVHFCSPVDCEWVNWNRWNDCSQQCGKSGTQYRTRSYSRQAKCGGIDCKGENFEEQKCNVFCYNGGIALGTGMDCICRMGFTGKCCECIVEDCKMTWWSEWSTCSEMCGTLGTRFRNRDVVQFPECGGAACTFALTEQEPCNRICYNGGSMEPEMCGCPSGFSGQCCECAIKHCETTGWSEWSTCSHVCGHLGTQFRTRDIQQSPECGGSECPSVFSEQQPCNHMCYNGGSLVASENSCRCLDGFSGQCCDVKVQDCAMIPWSQWSPCSHTCGPLGKQFRTRDIDRSSACGQTMLPSSLSEEQSCNQICQNGGTLSTSRCNCPSGYSGTCCECKIQDCAMNGWSEWSTCSEMCGSLGTRFRTRDVDKSPECGGAACTSVLTDQEPCNQICNNGGSLVASEKSCRCLDGFNGQCCDVKVQDCAMIPWNQWSPCSHACGLLGKQFRTRDIDRSSACGQTMFPSSLSEEQSCNQICLNRGTVSQIGCNCPNGYSGICCECEIQDCVMNAWSEWSTCSEQCGSLGTRFRTREVEKSPECGGTACTSALTEQEPCNRICNNGGSLVTSEKSCRCLDGFNGQCCDVKVQDCAMIPWSQWSSCSHTCGSLGKQFRTRDIDRSSVCGQTVLPSLLSEEQSCNQICLNKGTVSQILCNCPNGYNGICCECKVQDCVMTAWSEWSVCSKKCGPLGNQFRTRNVFKEPTCGGVVCPMNLIEQRLCNQFCYNNGVIKPPEYTCSCREGFSGSCCDCKDIDCSLSKWSDWSSCKNATRQVRSRDVDRYAKCAGKQCDGSFTEERSCADALKANILISKVGFGLFGLYAVLVTCFFGMVVVYFIYYCRKHSYSHVGSNDVTELTTMPQRQNRAQSDRDLPPTYDSLQLRR